MANGGRLVVLLLQAMNNLDLAVQAWVAGGIAENSVENLEDRNRLSTLPSLQTFQRRSKHRWPMEEDSKITSVANAEGGLLIAQRLLRGFAHRRHHSRRGRGKTRLTQEHTPKIQ